MNKKGKGKELGRKRQKRIWKLGRNEREKEKRKREQEGKVKKGRKNKLI
jgi:hypothetical protein